jgi:hypothetical protein
MKSARSYLSRAASAIGGPPFPATTSSPLTVLTTPCPTYSTISPHRVAVSSALIGIAAGCITSSQSRAADAASRLRWRRSPRAGGGSDEGSGRSARSCQTAVKKAAMRLNEQSRGRDHQSSDEGGQTRKQHEVAQEHTHTRPLTFAAWPPSGIQKVDCGKRSGSKASCPSGRTRLTALGARPIGSK